MSFELVILWKIGRATFDTKTFSLNIFGSHTGNICSQDNCIFASLTTKFQTVEFVGNHTFLFDTKIKKKVKVERKLHNFLRSKYVDFCNLKYF